MKRGFLLLFMMISLGLHAQDLKKIINDAFQKLKTDSQFSHSSISFYVEENKTRKVIFKENEQLGLAPASTQKIIISATAFELLKDTFHYYTSFYYTGDITNGIVNGDVIITPSGDPTFGSWRYTNTTESSILNALEKALQKLKIKKINGSIYYDPISYESSIPQGWVWGDIGNYFGASAQSFNWRENQYDLFLKSGIKIGDPVVAVETKPMIHGITFNSQVKSAAKGTGDRASISLPTGGKVSDVTGTIPIMEDRFSISGSMYDPAFQFAKTTLDHINGKNEMEKKPPAIPGKQVRILFYTHRSPGFDSINHFFMKRSINLYGEAFLKTMAYKTYGHSTYDSAVLLVKNFWKLRGIDVGALNIMDGSGLTPSNRITAHALVTVLQFATQQNWFNKFYEAIPMINNTRMKSGHIKDVIAYSGYIKSSGGNPREF
jgi:D-alanyl-D-alanine carboxypeptidase/D-alanyl-D-alanine-endopeptidase (penicillin-binding protein 4)